MNPESPNLGGFKLVANFPYWPVMSKKAINGIHLTRWNNGQRTMIYWSVATGNKDCPWRTPDAIPVGWVSL